jgi:RsiW-degrading membrane proteinase PrsW (M82 family)
MLGGVSRHHLMRYRRHLPAVIIAIVAVVAGLAADVIARNWAPALWRAERAMAAGDLRAAERAYWEALTSDAVDVPALLDFLAVHQALTMVDVEVGELLQGGVAAPLVGGPSVSEAQVEAFLDRPDLPDGAGLVGRFWRGELRGGATPEIREEVEAGAAAEPPRPWTNHVLGEVAADRGNLFEAAAFFEREGLRPDGPASDLEQALMLYRFAGAHDEVVQRIADPRFDGVVSPWLRSRVAFEGHRWGAWLGWLWPASYLRGSVVSWCLAALSALLWGWFCWRLGGRFGWLVVAFGLGALSIYPTHVLIHLEDVIPGLAETGDLVGDAIYFVFGVGLREEAAKLLCFLPLLPRLARRRVQGEALIYGAAVGLGFAAIENVGYFEGGALGTTLARFLTANFLHMALTAVAAQAVYVAVQERSDRTIAEALNTFGLMVVLHGVYNLFLSTPSLTELSFLSMTTFVVLSSRFLRTAPRGRGRSGIPLEQVVVLSLVILTGASFVYGAAVVGPAAAAAALAQGLVGVAVILVMFHREL